MRLAPQMLQKLPDAAAPQAGQESGVGLVIGRSVNGERQTANGCARTYLERAVDVSFTVTFGEDLFIFDKPL